jgi:DNA-binding NtrC family response regulator
MIGAANKGTLFLDEVGFTDIEVQRALLTFLDNKKYNRYGETRDLTADVRLIFGTNQDLRDRMREGLFDPAFYERIAGMIVNIPALSERRKDIEALASRFVERLNEDRSETVTIENAALELLATFRWPGNIRQLRSYVQNLYHACLRSGSDHRITCQMIEQDKPRDTAYLPDDPISALELLIRKTMIGWNDRDGRFVTDFLEPIVAKVYLDDLRFARTDASKRIGLDGTRGKDSTLEQRYLRYAKLREIHER